MISLNKTYLLTLLICIIFSYSPANAQGNKSSDTNQTTDKTWNEIKSAVET
jgi:hypothetical protein